MRLTGVSEVVAGYTGGHIKNPAYREVCGTGRTGHAECVQITFDPSQISFQTLLAIIFFDTHENSCQDTHDPFMASTLEICVFPATIH